MQNTNREKMPEKFKNSEWLPKCMISLDYWDLKIKKIKLRCSKDKIESASQFSIGEFEHKYSNNNFKHENVLNEIVPKNIYKIRTIETIIRED